MAVLDHERLAVYQLARELSREIARLTKKIRSRRPDLNDQLLRAIASIPLNIAEGNGEQPSGRRAYFLRIARSSATEVSAVLDHMVDVGLLTIHDIAAAKDLLVRIVSILIKLTNRAVIPASRPRQPRHPKEASPGTES